MDCRLIANPCAPLPSVAPETKSFQVSMLLGGNFFSHLRRKARLKVPFIFSRTRNIHLRMPEICRFRKIKIRMHYGDHEHPPPHFHAKSPTGNAMLSLNGLLMEGYLPPAELRLVQAWALQHAEELAANWELCMRNESPFKIDPLK